MLMKGDKYGFLSNMYPCDIPYEGITYLSSETLYQAAKCDNPNDVPKFEKLNGFAAKKLGRNIVIRPDWDSRKIEVMREILAIKFANPELAKKLKELTEPIVEDNYWGDTFWGVCKGVGENNLGKLLMELREQLIANS